MTDRELIAGSSSAVEDLVRAAMGAGAMCIMEKAAAGEIDPRAPLGDALGDFPAEFVKIRAGLVADVVAELAAQHPPLGYADTKPIGYVGATIGRKLVTTMMSARREDLHTDRTHYEVWRAAAATPGAPAAYAVVFDSGGDPRIDTTSLDGSLDAAERRVHSWLSGDYQAYVVALVELREVQS